LFKASIILVLLAFGALAYGWVENNDTILYGSIGASALAGLALLVATRAEKKAGYAEPKSRPERAERPPREPRERRSKAEDGARATSRKRRGSALDSGELTRQLEMPSDDDEDEVPLESLRPRGARARPPKAPAGAVWATESDDEFEEEDLGQGPPSYDADFPEEDEYSKPAAAQGAAAADDFRSRLAAVLGTTGEQEGAPAPAQAAPPRARRVTPVPIDEPEEYDAPAFPPVAAPKRRGRRKPDSYLPPEPEVEPEESEEAEPEWIRIEDVPRISEPEGAIAKPAPTDEMIHYRPRRPTIAAAPAEPDPEPDEEPAPPPTRRRKAPAPAGESSVRPVSLKRQAPAERTAVTRVSGTRPKARSPKEQDPDAPPPRRGRPPKQRP
jgi:hypothetical protein